MGEVLGINFLAIQFIFDIYEIYDPVEKQDLFDKILTLDAIRCKERSKQLKNQINQKKK